MQSQQPKWAAGYGGGQRNFAVNAGSVQQRFETPRQNQLSQQPIGFGVADPGFGKPLTSAQTRPETVRAIPQIQWPSGYSTQAGASSSVASQPRKEQVGATASLASHPRKDQLWGVQPSQRPGAYGSRDRCVSVNAISNQLRLDPPRPNQPLQPVGGYSIQKCGLGVDPASAIQAREPSRAFQPLDRPRVTGAVGEGCKPARLSSVQEQQVLAKRDEPLQQPSSYGTAEHTAAAKSANRDSDAIWNRLGTGPMDLRSAFVPVPGPGPTFPTSRATCPSVKKPNQGRIEQPAISLDEFLDVTNAVATDVPACRPDEDAKGDSLLSKHATSFSKVDANELQPTENAISNPGIASMHMPSPSPSLSFSAADLDREITSAEPGFLCHTATPKLSHHPRGLLGVGGPVTFVTSAQTAGGSPTKTDGGLQSEATPASPKANEAAEDVSLTWKLLGVADNVIQFFSSLRSEEHRRFTSQSMRHTLPNPKRLPPDELFELRQQDQIKQAAHALRDAVTKLIAASGTTNADAATLRLPVEIRSRFSRLRLHLVQAFRKGQQPACDVNAVAADLERFISMCNYLAQAEPGDFDKDVRQEFISFSQRHAQDLESHCLTFRWLAEQRGNVGSVSGTGSGVGLSSSKNV